MAQFQKLKETIRVNGTVDVWFAKCWAALEQGSFWVVRADKPGMTFEARYKGVTIDGTLRIVLTQASDKVVIDLLVAADCANVFAWFTDPRTRIRNAFTTHLWDKPRHGRRGRAIE